MTKQLLRHISRHLSSRDDCRKVEYQVWITPGNNGYSRVIMDPVIYVYRNISDRKVKYTIIDHILTDHLYSELHCMKNHNGEIFVKTEFVNPGLYIFRKSFRTGKRQWMLK